MNPDLHLKLNFIEDSAVGKKSSKKKLNNILNLSKEKWKDAGMNIIPNEHQINKGIHLFEKIEDAKIKEQLSKLTK